MTPQHIKVLLMVQHGHDTLGCETVLQDLEKYNLIIDAVDAYRLSEKGQAFVELLSTVEIPTQIWVDANGKEIKLEE